MTFVSDTVKKQVIALLGLAVRSTAGVPTYSTSLGDNTYADDEIDRGISSSMTQIMQAICDTDGHGDRPLFTSQVSLTHGEKLDPHCGSIGVPIITPFDGATYTLTGKIKSIAEISAYRANPNNIYCLTAHDASRHGFHSKLAGFYAKDEAIQAVHFTGYSAVCDLTNFTESDYTLLPDKHYPLATDLAIANLKKDGDVSDIFDYHARKAAVGLANIRGKESDQPSPKKTVGVRDSGLK